MASATRNVPSPCCSVSSATASGVMTAASRLTGVSAFMKAPTPGMLRPAAMPHRPSTSPVTPVANTAPTALPMVPLLLMDHWSPTITAKAVKASMTSGYSSAPSGSMAGTATVAVPEAACTVMPPGTPMPFAST